MKKHILSWDFLYACITCLFGGLLDGFSFVFKDRTLCLIQSGNLVKSIVAFTNNQIHEGLFSLILVLVFCLFIYLFYLLMCFLKSKNINFHFVFMPLIMLLLIPSFVWNFDNNDYLNYRNIISCSFLSMIGAISMILFRSIRFKFDNKIIFNAAVMSGNMRSMSTSFGDFTITKNKELAYQGFFFFVMILMFSFGVAISSLCFVYVKGLWNLYSLLIIIYLIIFSMIIIFHFRYKWIRNIKTKQSEIIE